MTKSFFIVSLFLYCTIDPLHAESFYSQCGQDKYILTHFFPDKKDGFFIEIGAFDGIKFSNTYFFEKRGWKGICVEPLPFAFEQLKKNRSCISIYGCITDHEGIALFRYVKDTGEMLSGLVEKYDPRHVARIENARVRSDYLEVPCYRLSRVLHDYNIKKIDFLSIDTEGGELDILKSLTHDELARIDVICVEDNFYDSQNCEIVKFLTNNNFEFIVRLEQDLIFRNKRYK